MQNKLYVGNLNYRVTQEELSQLFEKYGNIVEVKIPKDAQTNQARGFAFVTFEQANSAEQALEQNGQDFLGRPLKVNVAIERQDRGRGGNGGGGRRSSGHRSNNHDFSEAN